MGRASRGQLGIRQIGDNFLNLLSVYFEEGHSSAEVLKSWYREALIQQTVDSCLVQTAQEEWIGPGHGLLGGTGHITLQGCTINVHSDPTTNQKFDIIAGIIQQMFFTTSSHKALVNKNLSTQSISNAFKQSLAPSAEIPE